MPERRPGNPDLPPAWAVPIFDVVDIAPRRHRHVVVIPVINEGERIRRQLREMLAADIPGKMDVVVVDGGSTDGSLDHAFLEKAGVRTLLTKTGPGKLSAQLRCAYAWALQQGYDGILTIDGNGKDGVDTLPLFAQAIDEGYGYVQASRFRRGGHHENTPLSRWVAIRLIHAPVQSLGAGTWLTDTTQGYRAYSAEFLRDPRTQPFRDIFQRYELLAYLTVRAGRLGYPIKEIATSRVYPAGEKAPTKIAGVGALADLVAVVFRALAGSYDPPAVGSA